MFELSVVVPVYKVEKYLSRCIESILNQDFCNFQLILVDDGSPDNCGTICDEYASKDNRIKVIHKENGGLSSARNAGIDISTSEYITFIDSDDYIHPCMFSSMLKGMKNHDADISICSYLSTKENNAETTISNTFSLIDKYESITRMNNIEFITAWGKIYKTKLFEKIRYPVGKYHEDEFITYKLFYESNKIVFTEDKLYYYYVNPESIIQSSFSEKNLDSLDVFKERIMFFEKKNEHELTKLSQKTLMSRIMYCHQCISREKSLKNKSKLKQKALSYLDKTQKKEFISSLSSKQKMWANLFFVSPFLYSTFRNSLKIGL